MCSKKITAVEGLSPTTVSGQSFLLRGLEAVKLGLKLPLAA